MKGLAKHTEKIIDAVSNLNSISPYVLVGGTALSLQLDHRQSEDFDFMRWSSRKGEKMEVDWFNIEKELKTIGQVQKTDLLGFDHVQFVVEDVKFSFYACERFSPVKKTLPFLNNIVIADIDSIAAMKMEVLLRRTNFRDYYDLYCIMQTKSPIEIKGLINDALKYSDHNLSSRNLLTILTTGERFIVDDGFTKLAPKYDITSNQIEEYMKTVVRNAYLSEEMTMK